MTAAEVAGTVARAPSPHPLGALLPSLYLNDTFAQRLCESLDEVLESIVIGQEWDRDVRIVLFVRLREGAVLDAALIDRITSTARAPRCSSSHCFLASPVPCSPVIVPPSSSAAR